MELAVLVAALLGVALGRVEHGGAVAHAVDVRPLLADPAARVVRADALCSAWSSEKSANLL